MATLHHPVFSGQHDDTADRLTVGERQSLWRLAAELADLTDDAEASRSNYARLVNSMTHLLAAGKGRS